MNFHSAHRQSGTYKLSEQERGDQEQTRALHEGPATGTGDEDQSLAHNTDLEVQRRHHLMLTVPDWPHTEFVLHNNMVWWEQTKLGKYIPIEEIDTKAFGEILRIYREEVGLVHSPEENDSHHGQITTQNYSSCKNLS